MTPEEITNQIPNNERTYVLKKLKQIATKYEKNQQKLKMETIARIYDDIDREFYGGFLSSIVSKKDIRFYSIDYDFEHLMECSKYDEDDRESRNYRFGLGINIDTIRDSITSSTKKPTFYSGGFKTKSAIEFIILMMLHETIHLIEYMHPQLDLSDIDHSVFFYRAGYKLFKMISQFSTIIEPEDKLFVVDWRYLVQIVSLISEPNNKDGAKLLNDKTTILNDGFHYYRCY